MAVEILDKDSNIIIRVRTQSNQAASLTQDYTWLPGQYAVAANAHHYMGLPNPCILPSGYKVRVYDSAAIDAAADDMTVGILLDERTHTRN
jgi:hypothetical protein